MAITKDTILFTFSSGNVLLTLINLLNISKKYDELVHAQIKVFFDIYADCVKEIRANSPDFDKKMNLSNRITLKLKQILDDEIQADWIVEEDDPSNYKEDDEFFAEYPHLFDKRTENDINITILFLASNPIDTEPLRIGNEFSKIERGIQNSDYRDNINVEQRWATRITDLRRAMLKYSPNIVHFSGHGSEEGEIILEDDEAYSKKIAPEALGNFFNSFVEDLNCVVLNACYSEDQAIEIQRHIPYVVGMRKGILDLAAIRFSEAFYDGLGAGRTIPSSFKLGVDAIAMFGLDDEYVPVLVQTKD